MSQEMLTVPAKYAEAVTPSDATVIYSRGLYVGGAGNLVVAMEELGNVVTFQSVPAGTTLSIRVSRVMAATTATNIVRMF